MRQLLTVVWNSRYLLPGLWREPGMNIVVKDRLIGSLIGFMFADRTLESFEVYLADRIALELILSLNGFG